jgi:hypothetical protein
MPVRVHLEGNVLIKGKILESLLAREISGYVRNVMMSDSQGVMIKHY